MSPETKAWYRNVFEPNPVLVRELKQFVRNRLLLYFMLSYLALLSIVTVTAMIDHSLLRFTEELTFNLVNFRGQASQGLFQLVLFSYFTFTSAFLILFGAIKMGFERLKDDLGYYTTLSSWRIVAGKFLLGATVSMVFLSLALPFLTIAYMMRGLGLNVIVYSTIYFYLYTLIQYSVTLAFFSGAKTLKRIYLFGLTLLLVQTVAFFIGYGFGSNYTDGYFIRSVGSVWPGFLIQAMFILMPLPFAVCQVSPESANRMLPIRLAMTAMLFLMVLSVFALFVKAQYGWGFDGQENLFYGIGFCTYFFIPYAVLIGMCEREKYTIRQRLHIPKNLVGRLVVFPFGTGVCNALAWFCGFNLFLAGFYLFLEYGPSMGRFSLVVDQSFVDEVLRICVPFSILLFDYALTAFLLWKVALHRVISREWLAFGILGLSIGFYISIFVMEVFNLGGGYETVEAMFDACFFLPVLIFEGPYGNKDIVIYQTLLGVVWGIFLLAVMGWFWLHAFGRFTRYEGTRLSPPEPEKEIDEMTPDDESVDFASAPAFRHGDSDLVEQQEQE